VTAGNSLPNIINGQVVPQENFEALMLIFLADLASVRAHVVAVIRFWCRGFARILGASRNHGSGLSDFDAIG
jgi:hypothetical protein